MRSIAGLALTALLLLPCRASADGPLLSANEDDVVVHHLAHFGAGTLVAVVPDLILTRFSRDSWERAWGTRLAVDCVVAVLATDIYEAQTGKDSSTRLQHDLDGALGAAAVVGASVSWTFR